MIKVQKNDLHPNSIISELKYSSDSTLNSIAPENIEIDNVISLKPIFKINFKETCKLYRYTDEDVFKHYGSTKHNFHSETKKYMQRKKEMWESADWFEYGIIYKNNLIGKTYLNAGSRLDSFERGIWLRKDYWGIKYHRK